MASTIASSAPVSKPAGKRRGFSLVELMVASSEGILLMSMVLGVLVSSMSVGASIGNYSDMSTQARIAMSTMESDLRAVSHLSVASGTRMEFQVVNGVNSGIPSVSSIAYTYDGATGTLRRESPIGANGRLVMSDLKNCQFQYFDGADAPAANPLSAKKVLIYAEMQRRNVGKLNTDTIVSAVVVMRAR